MISCVLATKLLDPQAEVTFKAFQLLTFKGLELICDFFYLFIVYFCFDLVDFADLTFDFPDHSRVRHSEKLVFELLDLGVIFVAELSQAITIENFEVRNGVNRHFFDMQVNHDRIFIDVQFLKFLYLFELVQRVQRINFVGAKVQIP